MTRARRSGPPGPAPAPGPPQPAEIERLYHELRVHQVELEQQNEELRAARTAAEAALARLSDLYDRAPIAYLSLGPDGRIVEANRAAVTLLGRPAPALRARTLAACVVPASVPAVARLLAGSGEPVELVLVRASGRTRVGQAQARHDPIAEVIHVAIADVTERVTADALRARRVEQRAEYLARVEHTLRTNLSIVLGWSEMLTEKQRPLADAERRAAAAAIARNAAALLAHVEGLLGEARATARVEILESVPVDVAALAAEVVADYVGRPGAGTLRAVPRQGVVALAAADALATVLRHLVENAARAAGPAGHVTVRARTRPAGIVEIDVRDDGPGIAPGTQLFAAFAGPATAGRSGLGLHVVRTLVEAMGGSVRGGDRTDGPGAAFTVSLPAPDAGPALPETTTPASP